MKKTKGQEVSISKSGLELKNLKFASNSELTRERDLSFPTFA